MNVGASFSVSDVGEIEIYGLDFTNDLSTGDAISGATWSCSVAQGTDPNPSARLSGLPWAYSATATAQKVIGGVAGVIYILQAVVTTRLGYTLSLWAYAPCEVIG